ncbi:MAG: hypothetical protein EB127_02090 [Alphaproteobacteria bacterium]|nr:hypothetical protein [Alphaproteobacteria bacterium]
MTNSIILSKTDLLDPKNTKATMDYHSMSLAELKQVAKNHTPKIKQYYIRPRLELIKLLTMKSFPEEMLLEKKTIAELRKEAQDRKLPNIWKLRRAELLELLHPSSKQDNKNDNDRQKHDDPEEREGEEVGVNIVKDAT